MGHVKRILFLLLAASVASAQTYYSKTTINPTSPFSLGSSLTPTYLNSYTITGTVTANSTTFTCVTGCTSLRVGQGITGSDGVNLIFPSSGGQLGTLITSVGTGINGATITVSIATNPSLTPGTYTLTIGKDRWSTTSTALVNSLGTTNIWAGNAAQGNSTWAQAYLSGDCDTGSKVTNCFLMNTGAGSVVNNFWGARTSDNTSGTNLEANISLAVNDDTSHSQSMWNHYWETINLTGAGTSNQSRALESTIYNYNATSGAYKPDPYAVNKLGGTENIRLSVGQSGVGTLYNSMDALSIVGINGSVFEVGILFDATSLDTTLTHPPAMSLPAGANGYGVTWYKATGYSTPAWNLYATNTTNNGNLFALNDTTATVTIPNNLGTGLVTLGSGYLGLSGNHTGTFNGQGSNLEIATNTINDPTSSGTIPTVSINHIGTPTLTSTSTTTLSVASTLGITGCPIASTNVTITLCYAVRVFGDIARFDGSLEARGGLTATGAAVTLNASSDFNVGINTGTSAGTTTIGNASSTYTLNAGTVSGTGWAHLPAMTTASAFTSTLATGTAPFTIASTTNVANLNASLLNGTTFAAPAAIGSGTPAAGTFTTLNATGLVTPSTTVGIKGTAAADSVQAGSVGEVFSVNCPSPTTATITMTIATPAVVTWSSHPFAAVGATNYECPINFTTTGALPTGVVAATNYYIDGATLSGDTFQISDTAAHALAGTNHVATSGSQSGTQTGFMGALAANATFYGAAGVSLTAGDWDCSGVAEFGNVSSLTTVTGMVSGIHTTAASPSGAGERAEIRTASTTWGAVTPMLPTPTVQENVSATTTVYTVADMAFGGGSQNTGGFLRCRRMR